MSKIAFSGNAAGTATFTVASPATNTDRTITLPDLAGTIAVANSGTPNATTFLRGDQTWASAADGVGYGQTWQYVAGSRVVSTSYQNTTGKPIQIAIRGSNGNTVQASIDNSTWVSIGSLISASGVSMTNISAVIPNNHYYRVNGGTVNDWSELR